MKQNKILLIIAWGVLFTGIWPAHGKVANEVISSAGEFSLLDQYGKSYQINYPQEKICILIFADKGGVSQVEGWVRPFYETYQDTVLIHGVAQLDGVPKWLRFILVRIFKRKVKFSVMMDWTGDVCRAYGYPGGKAFVVIVDREGNIRYTVNGKASKELIEECCKIINILKPVPQQSALR